MTTLVKITITLILSFLVSSCGFDFSAGEKGNGTITQENREITESFAKISASEGLQVYVSQSDDFSIKVEGDENIIDFIGTEINHNTLKIYTLKNIGTATKNIYVSLPTVEAFEIASGAQVQTENILECTLLHIDASSGAILSANINAESVGIEASSGSNLSLSGRSKNTEVDASSGALINASDLSSILCEVAASSGANVSLNVTESLRANARSGANISYKGEAKVTTKKSVSGAINYIE